MANTQNYGLCAPHLPVRGAAVNQTVERMEAGIRRAQAGVALAGRHMYQMLLRDDYENKNTGYWKGLFCDSFRTQSGIESLSTALTWDSGGQRLKLTTVGATQVGRQLGGALSSVIPTNGYLEEAFTAPCTGVIHTVRIYVQGVAVISLVIGSTSVDTVLVESRNHMGAVSASFNAPVTAGAACKLSISGNVTGSNTQLGRAAGTGNFGFLVELTPTVANSAVMVGTARDMGRIYGGARAWVQHSGGALSLGLWDTDAQDWRPMDWTGRAAAVTVQGTVCQESTFALDTPEGFGPALKPRLGIETATGNDVYIYDYGIMTL